MPDLICGWHKMYYPDEDPPVLGPFEGRYDSHGICDRCRVRFEAEDDARPKRPAVIQLSRETINRRIGRYEQAA